ncbi:YopX family protein [Enterococcus avium]|uniref:YopX family protein n=1 Tax=Enterococcus avium TaxID=33945 RepID=UPI0025B19354|nr:YopX family protein [Enterococcus avium]MDN2639300.1 YopX family protein [Enterococcus avium]
MLLTRLKKGGASSSLLYNKLEMEVSNMIPKFRAWVKPGVLSNHPNGVVADAKPDFLGMNCLVKRDDLKGKECFTEIIDFEDIELMQSTGLNDLNCAEIFEGYIVRVFEYGIYGGTYNAPVSWIKYETEQEQWAFHGFTCVGVKEIEHHPEVGSLFTRGFLTRKFGSCVQLSELTKDSRNSIEVIGNIYENPELLEVE